MPSNPPPPITHTLEVVEGSVYFVRCLLTYFLVVHCPCSPWFFAPCDFLSTRFWYTLPLPTPLCCPSPLGYPHMDTFGAYRQSLFFGCGIHHDLSHHAITPTSHIRQLGCPFPGDPLPVFCPADSLWCKSYFQGWQGWWPSGMGYR